jgi:protease-4
MKRAKIPRPGWLVILLACALLPACAVVRLPLGPSEEIREVTLAGQGQDKVLLVDLAGELSFRRPWGPPGWPRGENLPTRLRSDLDLARKDPDVRALLVRIDSAGGTVSASDVLFHEIRSFREETDVPVVAAVVEKGLSGGYYVSLAADEIVAHPTALVGAVGVYVVKFDASQLLDRWGIRSELVKSSPQKDLFSPLRPLSAQETATLDAIVQEFNERFQETLRTARTQATDEDMEIISSGAPFTARRALELHLVDRVGYTQDAFQAAMGLAGIAAARLVTYRRDGRGPAGSYSSPALADGLEASLLFLDRQWLEQVLAGGAYYGAPRLNAVELRAGAPANDE